MNSYFVVKVGSRYLRGGRLVRRMSQAQIFTDSTRDNNDYVHADANDLMRMQLEIVPVIVENRTITIVRRKQVVDRRNRAKQHYRDVLGRERDGEIILTEPARSM